MAQAPRWIRSAETLVTQPAMVSLDFPQQVWKNGPKFHFTAPHSWLIELAERLNNVHFEQPASAMSKISWYDRGYQLYDPWGTDLTMFTDVVVNLDGNNGFGGGNFGYLPFPSIDYIVEANRGNLDSANLAFNSNLSNSLIAAAQDGYKKAYTYSAAWMLQPKVTVESALSGFVQKLGSTSDCHLGLVVLNNRAGLSPWDTVTVPAVSWACPQAGNTTVALPQIPLNAGAGNNNQALLQSTLFNSWGQTPLLLPTGGSNLADGLKQAYSNLTGGNSRSGALKAIVVFTDKVPDRDLSGNAYTSPDVNGGALADAIAVANQCKAAGIPIFMVTLDQTGGRMTPFLSAQFSESFPGGLVATSGHGGALYIEQWSNPANTLNALTGDFNNIVRQLMTLVSTPTRGCGGGK